MPDTPPFLNAEGPELSRWFEVPTYDQWTAAATKTLKGRPVSSLKRQLPGGVEIPPLAQPAPVAPIGSPDAPPYVRGAGGEDRRQAGWDIRQWVGVGSAAQAKEVIEASKARGSRSVWLVLDGIARGSSVPIAGLALHSAQDLQTALSGVDLAATPVDLEVGESAPGWWRALVAAAQAQGVPPEHLTGSVVFDPIGEWVSTGILHGGPEGAFQALCRHVSAVSEQTPWVHGAGVDTTHWADAGADPALELGLGLASLVTLLRHTVGKGLSMATLAPRLRCRLSVGRDTFVEIAKLRAWRKVFARVMAACGASDEEQRCFIHGVTSGAELTRFDPWVNLLRGTSATFSGAVAGVDALTVLPFDLAVGAPSPLAMRMSTNTQQVLERESHLARVMDPAGGSWYLEQLTDGLARAAWAVMQGVESRGGLLAGLREGTVQLRLAQALKERERKVASRKVPVVGVSEYPNATEEPLQRDSRVPVARRSGPEVLDGGQAQMDAALAAGTCPGSWTSTEPVENLIPIGRSRVAQAWEQLRVRGESGTALSVHLVCLGALPRHKARADFARRLLQAGGMTVTQGEGSTFLPDLVSSFEDSGSVAVILCGHDADYPEFVPHLVPQLKASGALWVGLAGKMGEHGAAWKAAGVDAAVHLGAPVLRELEALEAAVEANS